MYMTNVVLTVKTSSFEEALRLARGTVMDAAMRLGLYAEDLCEPQEDVFV